MTRAFGNLDGRVTQGSGSTASLRDVAFPAAILALTLFGVVLLGFFDRPISTARPDIWARAPYSDALAPWLQGGLQYVLDLPQINYLYRPTVGLFWGSIIGITDRLWLIPQALASGLFVFLVVTLWLLPRGRSMLVFALFLSLLATVASVLFPPLLINTLYVDFAALVFTLAGTWLLITACRDPGWFSVVIASVLLGIAATIRGPMMFGGPVLIVLTLGWSSRKSHTLWLTCLAAFAAPIAVDVALQRMHRTANNGIESLYCVATDSTRSWSAECSVRYHQLQPSAHEVLNQYVRSVQTAEGVDSIIQGVSRRFATDVKMFELSPVQAVLISVAALSLACHFFRRRYGVGDNSPARLLPVAGVLALVGTLWGLNHLGMHEGILALGFILGLSLIALAAGERLVIAVITSYVACVVFLALLGYAAAYPRFAGTFSFLILLAVSMLSIPSREVQTASNRRANRTRNFSLGVLAMLLLLYSGSFWWPSDLRRTFSESVKGRQAALKLSYEPMLDRTLYITGAGGLIYTHGDAIPIGGVRPYTQLKYADRYGNLSMLTPNEFID